MSTQAATHTNTQLPIFDNAQAWYGRDEQANKHWLHQLSPVECTEIEAAVHQAIAKNVDLVSLAQKDFPLPNLAPRLNAIAEDIKRGRGFALIRGLDAQRLTLKEQAFAFCGIGAYLGDAVSQNAKGHVLGHVANLGVDFSDPTTRGYQTTAELRVDSN